MPAGVVGVRGGWVRRGAAACAVTLAVGLVAGPVAMAGEAQAGAILVAQADARRAPVAAPSAPVASGLRPETRAEFLVRLVLTRGLVLAPYPRPVAFADVPKTAGTTYQAVETATSAGIVRGFPGGLFRPNAPITMDQAAVMAARTLRFIQAHIRTVPGVAMMSVPVPGVPAWAAADVALVHGTMSVGGFGPGRPLVPGTELRLVLWLRRYAGPCSIPALPHCPTE